MLGLSSGVWVCGASHRFWVSGDSGFFGFFAGFRVAGFTSPASPKPWSNYEGPLVAPLAGRRGSCASCSCSKFCHEEGLGFRV